VQRWGRLIEALGLTIKDGECESQPGKLRRTTGPSLGGGLNRKAFNLTLVERKTIGTEVLRIQMAWGPFNDAEGQILVIIVRK